MKHKDNNPPHSIRFSSKSVWDRLTDLDKKTNIGIARLAEVAVVMMMDRVDALGLIDIPVEKGSGSIQCEELKQTKELLLRLFEERLSPKKKGILGALSLKRP